MRLKLKFQGGREFHPISHCQRFVLRCGNVTIDTTPPSFNPYLSFMSFVVNFAFTSPYVVIMLQVNNEQASIYFYFHLYTYQFTFLSYATSFKTKELTNQQIKDALRANNCTSVEFDEVKPTSNMINMLEYLKYPQKDKNATFKCIREHTQYESALKVILLFKL